jgi:hypothetical protein
MPAGMVFPGPFLPQLLPTVAASRAASPRFYATWYLDGGHKFFGLDIPEWLWQSEVGSLAWLR